MNTQVHACKRAALAAALCIVLAPAAAQLPRQQAEKELARKVPAGTVPACTLITRADVQKATGRNPYADPEAAGQGGWICNIGTTELKVYSGPKASEAFESTLKGFKLDKEPRIPAPAFGDRAFFLHPKPINKYQGNVGFLVAPAGDHLLVLSVDAPSGQSAESTRPALESLMKVVTARLR